jgi:hypothetical protein
MRKLIIGQLRRLAKFPFFMMRRVRLGVSREPSESMEVCLIKWKSGAIELKMKADQLEKLIADHKVRVYRDQSDSAIAYVE